MAGGGWGSHKPISHPLLVPVEPAVQFRPVLASKDCAATCQAASSTLTSINGGFADLALCRVLSAGKTYYGAG